MPFGYHRHPVKAVISDKTASRTIGTIYQNTCGRPILCIVSYTCDKVVATEHAYCQARVQNVTPPITVNSYAGLLALAGTAVQRGYFNLVFAVPNGDYYQVFDSSTGGSSTGLISWIEVEL